MKEQSTHHFSTLDTLRGIAALSVCLFHFTGASLPKLNNVITRDIFSWGWLGVEIFFVISGFIIPYIMIRNRYEIRNCLSFLGKRFVRVSPPAYIAMLLSILIFFLIDHFHLSKEPLFSKLSMAQVLHNFTYTIPFTEYKWVNGVFWTLAVEFQYYIFISLAFVVMFRSIVLFYFSALFLAGLYYVPIASSIQFFHYSSLFLMGGVALLQIEKRISKGHFLWFLGLLTLVAYFQLGFLPSLFGATTALAIVFLKIRSKVGEFLGGISYSIYLMHILIGFILEGLLSRLISPDSLPVKLALLASCVAGVIVFSWIFNMVVERYFVDLANRIFKRTQSPSLTVSTVGIAGA